MYVVSFPGAGSKRQVSTESGSSPRWSRDGRTIYFLEPGVSAVVAVTVRNRALELGRPARIIDGRPRRFDVAPDGRILAQEMEAATGAAPPPLTLVQNWTALLKK